MDCKLSLKKVTGVEHKWFRGQCDTCGKSWSAPLLSQVLFLFTSHQFLDEKVVTK
jgi:hypothetical protein